MKCPRDNNPLVEKKNDAMRLFVCLHCHGVWLQLNDFPEFLRKENNVKIANSGQPYTSVDQNETLACPVDGKPTMIKQKFKGIQTDICLTHQGIWLDGVEINSLVSQYRSGKLSKTKPDKYTVTEALADTAYAPDLLEASSEMICEVTEAVVEFVTGIMSV